MILRRGANTGNIQGQGSHDVLRQRVPQNRDIIAKQRARIQEVEAQLDAVDGIMKGEQRQLTQR